MWYALDLVDTDGLRDGLPNINEHVRSGNIVTLCDDLETFCDQMDLDLDIENIIIVEGD